jgi:hypothetical protein
LEPALFYCGYFKIYDGYVLLILVPVLFLWGKERDLDPLMSLLDIQLEWMSDVPQNDLLDENSPVAEFISHILIVRA